MSVKHTPGPWRVGNGKKERPWMIYAKNKALATLRIKPSDEFAESYRQVIVNALLIAAAPELLDACESMVELGCDRCGHSSGPNCIPKKCLYAKARAVIVKAKGEKGCD